MKRPGRIAEAEIYPFTIASKGTILIALGAMKTEGVLVRLRTDGGVVGWGEASPYAPITGDTQATAVSIGKGLAGLVRGRDPFELGLLQAEMDAFVLGQAAIKAAFEMALWDLCGKSANQPVFRLLGEYRRSFETDRTVYLDPPEAQAEKARAIVQEGFRSVKVKVGQAPELDIERMRAVRAAVGPGIGLRIDANQGWTPADAVRALNGMAALRIEFCEQPVIRSDWEGMRYVREHVSIPIMADEAVHDASDALRLARLNAADMVNIKLMKSGGILPSVRIAQVCAAANIPCMLGCMSEMRVAITAAAHVVASQPNAVYADLDSFTEHQTDPVTGGVELKDGTLTLPDGPGLGLDIDPAFLATLQAA